MAGQGIPIDNQPSPCNSYFFGNLKTYIDVYGNTASKDQVKLSELTSDFSN